MKNSDIIDNALDSILKEVAPEVEEELGEEIDFDDLPEVEFSKKHIKNMDMLFKRYDDMQNAKKQKIVSRRVAIILLAVLIISTVFVFAVEAWRIKIFNANINIKETHTYIDLKESQTENNSYTLENIILEYIPNGLTFEKTVTNSGIFNILFTNEDKTRYFQIDCDLIDSMLSIDSEDATMSEMLINGQIAHFSFMDKYKIIVWNFEEYNYTLSGNLEENELIKIAENVKKKNK